MDSKKTWAGILMMLWGIVMIIAAAVIGGKDGSILGLLGGLWLTAFIMDAYFQGYQIHITKSTA